MIRRPPRSTPLYSSAASDVYKRQVAQWPVELLGLVMKGLVVLAMREEEQALMVVLRLEEVVEQVEKMVPPSSFS